jgi:hypothetical protein
MKTKPILGVLGILAVLTWGLIWWAGSKPSNAAPVVTPRAEIPSGLTVSVIGFSERGKNVIIRFENHTREPIRLLRPLDGSEWGWLMPIYDLSITDDQGTQIPFYPRCGVFGLYANLKWPDDYRVQVLPGDAYEMKVSTVREIRESVTYAVSFRYQYKPKEKKTEGKRFIEYPDDLWVGEVSSTVKQLQFVVTAPFPK